MCLIVHKPANVTITREFADDVYTKNPDGFGIIYHEIEGNQSYVKIQKLIGNRENVWALLQEHADKELLIHWRMRTHGDIDLENCHPYVLVGKADGDVPSFMMHNGILSHGNAADTSKSDTWHYIRNTLRPLLSSAPDLLKSQAFRKLVERDIGGSNKFAIMDAYGEVTILNRHSGIEWEGMWLSNTYAWSAYKFGAVKYTPPTTYKSAWTGASTKHKPTTLNGSTSYPTTTGDSKGKGKGKGKQGKLPYTVDNPPPKFENRPVIAEPSELFKDDREVTDTERNDVYDLLHDISIAISSIAFRLVTPEKVLNLLREMGFEDACELVQLAFNGEITETQLVQAVCTPSAGCRIMYGTYSKQDYLDELNEFRNDEKTLKDGSNG